MDSECMKRAIYPGTFDPITNGHLDLIGRSLKIFDELVVAVAESPSKRPLFTTEERLGLIREAVSGLGVVRVESFGGLLAEYAHTRGGVAIVRGLRAVSDFEYELQLALMNRKLQLEIETVFLMPSLRYIFLSSTIVKEAASFGGDIRDLVPECVARALSDKFSSGKAR